MNQEFQVLYHSITINRQFLVFFKKKKEHIFQDPFLQKGLIIQAYYPCIDGRLSLLLIWAYGLYSNHTNRASIFRGKLGILCVFLYPSDLRQKGIIKSRVAIFSVFPRDKKRLEGVQNAFELLISLTLMAHIMLSLAKRKMAVTSSW